jgi:hypothetical protein
MEILSSSTIEHTYCQTNHLTEFTSGANQVIPTLNFDYIWANASFLQNLTIYLTAIIMTSIYIILMIITRQLDKIDEKKLGLCRLPSYWHCNYLYEVIVYTGMRPESATDSNVCIIIGGEKEKTEPIILKDSDRASFRRGGIDSFIISTVKPLGKLIFIKIWHDNSGKNEMASWYLKHIIVHDLQTREKEYFISEKWLAVEKQDGKLDRLIPASGEKQKKELGYLLIKQTKDKITDGYLWFSIFSKPIQSSLTRIDRTTNCFLLLYLIMLSNIINFTLINSATSSDTPCEGLSIGNNLCIELSGILRSIVINLIIFVPTFIMLEVFKRTKKRKPHIAKLRELVGLKNYKLTKQNKFRFPWWTKIICHLLSIMIMIVSIFFTILYGIQMGDKSAQKWLSSILVSLFISVCLTGPVKAIITALLLAFLRRNKLKETDEILNDPDDDGSPIINKNNLSKSRKITFYSDISGIENSIEILKDEKISKLKQERIKEIKFNDMFKEITYSSLLLFCLFSICYSVDIKSGHSYHSALNNIYNPNSNINNVINFFDVYFLFYTIILRFATNFLFKFIIIFI